MVLAVLGSAEPPGPLCYSACAWEGYPLCDATYAQTSMMANVSNTANMANMASMANVSNLANTANMASMAKIMSKFTDG